MKMSTIMYMISLFFNIAAFVILFHDDDSIVGHVCQNLGASCLLAGSILLIRGV